MTASTRAPAPAEELERALFELRRVVVGQDRLLERPLVALLARGHCLLEGVPGVAKTLAVRTLARTVGGSFGRLQFTPDLVPSDIVGTRIFKPGSDRFDTELGPVFANLVLADEINRAPAKVQSALLEVMAERQVSLGGRTHPVPEPFLVLATQHPIESEGVYALPEAQRDRFLLKVDVGYPSGAEELAILYRMGARPPSADPVLSPDRVLALQDAADAVFVHHAVAEYVVRLVLATREPAVYGLGELAGTLDFGASPRATLGTAAPGRWRCAAGSTCCPRTSGTCSATSSRTGWCCRTTRWPTGSTRAGSSSGQAYEAASGEELGEVYADIGSSIGTRTERQEVSAWFVGAGLLAAAAAAAFSLAWFSRLP